MTSRDDPPIVGLRERKKAKTRAAIQQHALRLIQERGYAATTVEQIAEAAEVSPSTFFRYFPAKEDVVVWDKFDDVMIEAFRAQPADLTAIQAMRGAVRSAVDGIPADEWAKQVEREALIRAVPELRARMIQELVSMLSLFCDLLAERTGRKPDDQAVRTLAGAVTGVGLAVLWHSDDATLTDVADRFDAALGQLETGLRL